MAYFLKRQTARGKRPVFLRRAYGNKGAIVGTATYSGNNTNIATGSHGVLLAPAYEIQVDTFIPQEYVPDPSNPEPGDDGNMADYLFYSGSMRKNPLDGLFTTGAAVFSKNASFISRQKVMATVFSELDPTGSQEQEESNDNPASVAHITQQYEGTQFTYGPGISPAYGTAHFLPNQTPYNSKQATPQTATVTVTHPASRVVQAEFVMIVGNPLATGSYFAPVYCDITVKIDASTTPPTYTLSGNHKLFPAYEIYINQQLVHDYSPIPGGYTPAQLVYPDSSAPSLSDTRITSACATEPGLTGTITNQP